MDEPVGNRIVPDGLAPIAILGVTASGKSSLALHLAEVRGDVELVSVDSMQVYRTMDIGTAKPTRDEQARVRHHVLDLVDPSETFDLARFQGAVAGALADIASRCRRAVLVGGTGLYLRSIVDALDIPGQFPDVLADLDGEPDTPTLHARLALLDPAAAEKMEPTNRRRVLRALEVTIGSGRPFSSFGPGFDAHPPTPIALLGIRRTRDDVARRIADRYQQQLADGFLAEVRRLHAGPPLSHTARQALGYRELLDALDGADLPDALDALDTAEASASEGALDAAIELAVLRTRQFAVRQERWFRRDPRITWLDIDAAQPATWTRATDEVVAFAEARWGAPANGC